MLINRKLLVKTVQEHRKHIWWTRSLNKRAICLVERLGADIYCTTGSQRSVLKNGISQRLYVAPWNQSKGQLKTLVINFTANQKPLYSTKPASLLNLFFWWNQRKVHPNIIISIMAQFFCYLCKLMFSNGAMWNLKIHQFLPKGLDNGGSTAVVEGSFAKVAEIIGKPNKQIN